MKFCENIVITYNETSILAGTKTSQRNILLNIVRQTELKRKTNHLSNVSH